MNFTDPDGLEPIMRRFPLTGPYAKNVAQAIRKIQALGHTNNSKELRSQLLSGELKLQKSRYNVGFTDPATGNISIDKDFCEAGATEEDDFVRLVALLFHESTHKVGQGQVELAGSGTAAYGYPRSAIIEANLEVPVYEAQKQFLQDWAAVETDQAMSRAIQKKIGVTQNQIRIRLDRMRRHLDAIKDLNP